MFIVDIHCHLDKLIGSFFKNIDELILFINKNNIKYILSVSVNIKNFFYMSSILSPLSYSIKMSCGIHPLYVNRINKKDLLLLEKICFYKNVIAIGECGLDYKYINKSNDKEKQIKLFIKHLILSKKTNKPIIIHTRFSFNDTFNIIKNINILKLKGILHCYSYNGKKKLFKFLDLGLYISISGLITFKNMSFLKKLIKYIPLDRLFIETDSPYLSPEPYRNYVNNPSRIIFIMKIISDIKKISLSTILNNNFNNFIYLFNF